MLGWTPMLEDRYIVEELSCSQYCTSIFFSYTSRNQSAFLRVFCASLNPSPHISTSRKLSTSESLNFDHVCNDEDQILVPPFLGREVIGNTNYTFRVASSWRSNDPSVAAQPLDACIFELLRQPSEEVVVMAMSGCEPLHLISLNVSAGLRRYT